MIDALRSRLSVKAGFLSALLLFSSSFALAADEAPKKIIPPLTHFTIATPGSQWLNVSRALTPEDFRDKIVLLDFWTYACVNCMHVIPELEKLEKEFKNDLMIVGVHSAKFDNEKDTDHIRQAILRYGIEHPVVNDKDFRIWRGFEIRSWPTLVLLKPNGEIAQTFTGEGHTDDIRKAVQALKKEFPKRSVSKLPIALEQEQVAKGEFFYPSKVVYDEASKLVFVADSSHQQIAVFTWDIKNPTNLKPAFRIGKSGEAGLVNGSYSSSRFRRPQGMAVSHGSLYIADTGNHVIRKVDLKAKTVTTIAGTGKQGELKIGKGIPAKTTALASPWDVTFHPDDGQLVVAMAGTHQLWSLNLSSGKFDVIAGTGVEGIEDGLAGQNKLAQPSAVSSLLGSLYFLDSESSSLRFYFETYVRSLVGTGLFDFGFKDGDRKKATLQHPLGLYADVTGIFIADTFNHSIRRYDPSAQTLETVVGDGKSGEGAESAPEDAKKTRLNEPSGITKLADGYFLISDTDNHRLVLWNRTTGKVERVKIEGEKLAQTQIDPEIMKTASEVVAQKRISLRLPNTRIVNEAKVNRTNPEAKIILPERYKLNAEGPSFARLFEGSSPKAQLKQEWKLEDLQKKLTLKLTDLSSSVDYVLQGTIYYCLDTKNAICEISSFSFPVHVDSSGQDKIEISLSSNATEKK